MLDFIANYRDISNKYRKIGFYTKSADESLSGNFVIYTVASICSLVLSILNLKDGYSVMLVSTLSLTIGMGISAFLVKYTNKRFLADILAGGLACVNFSLYAVLGANEGFAILWIIVLPPIIINVNRKVGIFVSVYFLIFVYVICYTPISAFISPLYTKTFIERFPLLCTLDFFITIYVWFVLTSSEKKLAVKSYIDELTGIYNRAFYNAVVDYIEENNMIGDITIVTLDLNNLKGANDKYGHAAGDALIKGAASIIDSISDKTIAACRIGGDEFVSFIKCSEEEIADIERRLIEKENSWTSREISELSVSYGIEYCGNHKGMTIPEILNIADEKMYKNKSEYYMTHSIERRQGQRRVGERRKRDLLNSEENEQKSV